MASFTQTLNPTPFGTFDTDTSFQSEADSMVVFVKQALGDTILCVELTSRQIFSKFEEASLEYSRHINEMRTKGELVNVLGLPTGSIDLTTMYPKKSLEFMRRQSEPYAEMAAVGGSYTPTLCYFETSMGKQDYDMYTEMKVMSGSHANEVFFSSLPSGSHGKIRVIDVFHFEPFAAQNFLLNASNMTNFLATNFNYESYVNSTVFYVLPVFEDVLRRSMLEFAGRVRRSNYSYSIMGTTLRLYPIPVLESQVGRVYLWVTVANNPAKVGSNPGEISHQDDSLYGINGPSNVPFGAIPYTSITLAGKQWIRQYTLALCRELLGLIRSKMETIPIPNAEVRLNGTELVAQGREDKEKLTVQLKEFLAELTPDKLTEREALIAEQLHNQLKYVPMQKAIVVG